MRNLLEHEYEKACLADDLAKRSTVTCVIPLNHISACVAARFKGQSYMKYNEDEMKRQLLEMGLKIGQERLAGTSRRGLVKFPSKEGCIYLLRRKGWMTAAELSMDEKED